MNPQRVAARCETGDFQVAESVATLSGIGRVPIWAPQVAMQWGVSLAMQWGVSHAQP